MQPPKHAKYIDIPYYIWYETKSKVVLGGAAFLAKGLYIFVFHSTTNQKHEAFAGMHPCLWWRSLTLTPCPTLREASHYHFAESANHPSPQPLQRARLSESSGTSPNLVRVDQALSDPRWHMPGLNVREGFSCHIFLIHLKYHMSKHLNIYNKNPLSAMES